MKSNKNFSRAVLILSMAAIAAFCPMDIQSGTPMMSIQTEAASYQTVYYNDGVYVSEIKNGKRNGYGTYEWDNGRVYTGYWKNNKANGYGSQTYADGTIYEGEYKNGKLVSGVIYYSDGGVYEGECNGSKRNGYGTMYYANGNTYTGEFKND